VLFDAIVISLAALLALAGLFQFLASRADARTFPPPGRMIDIGGRKLHARVTGTGAPVVVFESGISASSVNWIPIQPQVSTFAATCCYDRAGLGWSDSPTGTFDADRMVADLAALLDRLNLPAPYVLVGHSYGGLLVRLFAERYPGKVAALVLIDPVLACHWAQPNSTRARAKQRGALMARWAGRLAGFGIIRLATSPIVVRSLILPRLAGKSESTEGAVYRLDSELRKLPPEIIPVIRALWCRPKSFRAILAHLAALESSFAALQNQPLAVPLTVISAGNTPPEGLAEHRAVARLSQRGEHIVAQRSGHWIQLDEPRLVVDAIRRAVDHA
jgi:pimeloyl-ACP methyl ester carboxylesterase